MTEFEKQKQDISIELLEIISEAGFMRDYEFFDDQDDLCKRGESLLKNFHALINMENHHKDKTLKSYVDNYCMDKSKIKIKPIIWEQVTGNKWEWGNYTIIKKGRFKYHCKILMSAGTLVLGNGKYLEVMPTSLGEAQEEFKEYHEKIIREQIV